MGENIPHSSIAATPDAEAMAKAAEERMFACLQKGRSFRLEAGAGAGKTYALVEALKWLVKERGTELRRARQQVACITFTNVAADEISDRLGITDLARVSTIHSFLWDLLSPFQKALREELEGMDRVKKKWEEVVGEEEELSLAGRKVVYDQIGRLRIRKNKIHVSHDMVLELAVAFLGKPKFRHLWLSRFPILLIDEYQDTQEALMGAFVNRLLRGGEPSVVLGLFGDHWQKIYGYGCGLVDEPDIEYIPKGSNFRSVRPIVDALNRIRRKLPQRVAKSLASYEGLTEIVVRHTNAWPGTRGSGHAKNALSEDAQDLAIRCLEEELTGREWILKEGTTRWLRLTNKAVARSQGFENLLAAFVQADYLDNLENPIIAFFANEMETARGFQVEGRKTAALEKLGWGALRVTKMEDKRRASAFLEELERRTTEGTIGEVLALCEENDLLPDAVERYLRAAVPKEEGVEESDEEEARRKYPRERWPKLRDVAYREVIRWHAYQSGDSHLSTKHGVKGAQYDEVIVVFSGGWSQYDFPRMLAEWEMHRVAEKDVARFERARNLFYVAVSRPRYRLALLFLKTLEEPAIERLRRFFGAAAVSELPYPGG